MRILLAEDDRNLNRTLTEQLTNHGFDVDSCFDGEEALYYANQNIHDVISAGYMENDKKKYTYKAPLKVPSAASNRANPEESRWATVTEIEDFLNSQVSLRYNVIRRQCEISWITHNDNKRNSKEYKMN